MTKSMTGYGRAETTISSGKLCVEIKSLNGKTADICIKSTLLPKDKEIVVRKMIAEKLQRGSIDVFLTFEPNSGNGDKTISADVLTNYYKQVVETGEKLGIAADSNINALIFSSILRLPDIVETRKAEIISEEEWPAVEECFLKAVEMLDEFRTKEGQSLKKDVMSKVNSILSYVDMVESYEQERISAIKEKIVSKFDELKIDADQSRLEQEMIYYLEKLDINEEKVRLRQHCKYFLDTIENDPFPGKKLGFIAQEMGREINTTGSKSNHSEMQKLVVKMKDELEKIKEQSLNIL